MREKRRKRAVSFQFQHESKWRTKRRLIVDDLGPTGGRFYHCHEQEIGNRMVWCTHKNEELDKDEGRRKEIVARNGVGARNVR